MSTSNGESMEHLLDRKLGPLLGKIDDVVSKLNEVVNSLTFLSEKYDELIVKVSRLENREKKLYEENQWLKGEQSKLSKRVKDSELDQDELEQYSRRDCIEIRNIPVSKDEDTNGIVIQLASKLNVGILDSDISTSHRVPAYKPSSQTDSTPFDPVIIVKFARRDVRDRMYKARGKLKEFNTHDLGYTRTKERNIYIAESLTQRRKVLFKSSLKAKRDHSFKYIWSRNGKIFLRFDENSPAIHIKDEHSLLALGNRTSTTTNA